MAAQDDMIAAVGALEAAVCDLATAHNAFLEASRTVIRSAPSDNRQLTITSNIGPERLHEALVLRLRALGFGRMLQRSRLPGAVDESWTTTFQDKIRGVLP
jgi:hypothetical protein